MFDDEQVVVAAHDHVGICGTGEREDMIIGSITADGVFQPPPIPQSALTN